MILELQTYLTENVWCAYGNSVIQKLIATHHYLGTKHLYSALMTAHKYYI